MLYAGGVEWGRMCHSPRTRLKRFCVRLVTKWKEESGAELVEAALVIPILLMLLLGIVTFGRAYNVYQTMTRAAREGAKEAVKTPCAVYPNCVGSNTIYDGTSIRTTFVEPALAAANLDTTKITNYSTTYVLLDPNDPSPHICGLRLSFEYPYTFSFPFTGIAISTISFSTTVQMRLENQPSTCPVGNSF